MGLGSIGNQCTDLSYSKHALARFDLDQISQPCSHGLEIMGPALIMNTMQNTVTHLIFVTFSVLEEAILGVSCTKCFVDHF
jgi:hypothetical protein